MMELRKSLLFGFMAACCTLMPALAQGGDNEPDKRLEEPQEMPPTELDLPVDEKIKLKVEPFVPGSLVDRIVAPSTIVVSSANASDVEIFVVPVDAPYGGKAIEKPHSVGKDEKPADGFKISWTSKEHSPYVKVFAVVTRRSGVQRQWRSRTLDFAMSGARFEAKEKPQPEQQ